MKGRVAGQLDADTLGTIDDPLETTDDGSAADLRQAEGEAEDSMPVVLLFFSTAAHIYAAVWKKTVRERVSPTTTVASRKWLLATNCAGSYTYQQLN
jgi:hypothetical protein